MKGMRCDRREHTIVQPEPRKVGCVDHVYERNVSRGHDGRVQNASQSNGVRGVVVLRAMDVSGARDVDDIRLPAFKLLLNE